MLSIVNKKSITTNSKLFKSTNNNIILVIENNINKILNNAFNYSWHTVYNMVLHTTFAKIILANKETLSREDKKLFEKLPKDLIEMVISFSNIMKSIEIPNFTNIISKFIHFKIIIKETLRDSSCKICFSCFKLGKIHKYKDEIEKFFNEIMEATFQNEITKVFSSIISQEEEIPFFIDSIEDEEERKILDNKLFPNKLYSNEI